MSYGFDKGYGLLISSRKIKENILKKYGIEKQTLEIFRGGNVLKTKTWGTPGLQKVWDSLNLQPIFLASPLNLGLKGL